MANYNEEDHSYGYDAGSDYGYSADRGYGYGAPDGQRGRGSDAAGRAAASGDMRTQALPVQQAGPYGQSVSRQQQQPTRQIPANQRTQASAQQARSQQPYGQRPASQQPAATQGGFVSALDTATGGGGRNAYEQYSRGGTGYSGKRKPSMSRGKKAAIVVAVVVVIAALAAGAAYAFSEMRKAEVNADLHNMDEEELEAIDQQLTGHTDFTEPFTVLLLGSDERTDDPEMGARTDTIILVRVDPMNKQASMISIPRDTMVNLPGVGTAKINAAYYYGGAPATISAVKELTGVEIDHYVFVNFGGLVDLVNAIGGIDVYVDQTVDNPKAGNVIVEAGQQHLDGEHALTLARDRDYADGDYTRQVNQRKVIMGIIERVMNAPATDLAGLIQASTGFVTTDSGITFDWILSLVQQMRHVENNHDLVVTSTTLPSRPAYIGEVSYVIADVAGTAELMQIFLAGGDVSQALTQSSISTDVANAGGNYSAPEGYVEYEEDYYYEEPAEYYEEPAYVEPEPVSEEEPAESDVGGEETRNSGEAQDGEEG